MGGSSSRPRSHRDHRPTTAAAATASVSSSSRPHRHRSKDSHHNSKGPWITNFPPSPHSADFTASTDKSVTSSTMDYNGGYHQHNQQYQQNANYNPYAYSADTAMSSSYQSSYHRPQEKDRRVIEAEKILGEIAKEYAAKRAAGLVPTKPVPARTLLWEELARNRTQAGRRGQCIFGRDTDKICGCTSYKKRRTPGQDNPGGVCECCNHGAVWHRLVGGTMARSSSRMSRSIMSTTHHSNVAGSVRGSKLETASSYVPSEARSSMYDYDSDDYDDDDEDDEDIANEMAVPSNYAHNPPPMPPPPYMLQQPTNFGFTNERASLLSVGSSFGFPSRLSSGTNSLGALLQAIQRYRDMGLDEDEIEMRIREDFPPVPRKSSVAARSDLSQSQIDI